jgi:hypothetical protein
LGIVTTSAETAFARAPETSYDFVTNPANWPKIARGLDAPDAGDG